MDIQTDRLWLLGCGPDERSRSMVFSSDEKRDKMYNMFHDALYDWGMYMNRLYYNNEFIPEIQINEYDEYSYELRLI